MNSRIETPHEWGERQGKPENEATFAASNGSADLHACRWATRTKGRKPFDEPRWTKWHASNDGCRTLCGLVIIIATEAAFTPDTDDEMSRVDCCRCSRKLNPQND